MESMATLASGQRVHYVDHGGDGPTVLLLHSYLMDVDMFAPQVAALGADYRLIAMDERGQGGTPVDGPFDYWDLARDAFGLLDHLGIERAAVVGTSQGGFVALRMALLAPERVSALAVLGTSAVAEDPLTAASYLELCEAWANGPSEVLLDILASVTLGRAGSSEWRDKWREIPVQRSRIVLDALVSRDAILDRLGEIDRPALVLHGTKDVAYSVTRAEEIVAALPGAAPLVLVDGGAHFLSLTNPDEVNGPLAAFLAEHA
jgi:pimeloyl-ACP methyl ester carboxylesterase